MPLYFLLLVVGREPSGKSATSETKFQGMGLEQ